MKTIEDIKKVNQKPTGMLSISWGSKIEEDEYYRGKKRRNKTAKNGME
jgi:hypothetical protein